MRRIFCYKHVDGSLYILRISTSNYMEFYYVNIVFYNMNRTVRNIFEYVSITKICINMLRRCVCITEIICN